MEKKRKRRTKKEMELVRSSDEIKLPAQGLGDTIEAITEATGIKKLVKWIAGDDCGCDERKEALNKLFPYKKPLCLLEDEYNYLNDFFSIPKTRLKPTEQNQLLKIYSRVFQVRQEPTQCVSCWNDILTKLKGVYNEY